MYCQLFHYPVLFQTIDVPPYLFHVCYLIPISQSQFPCLKQWILQVLFPTRTLGRTSPDRHSWICPYLQANSMTKKSDVHNKVNSVSTWYSVPKNGWKLYSKAVCITCSNCKGPVRVFKRVIFEVSRLSSPSSVSLLTSSPFNSIVALPSIMYRLARQAGPHAYGLNSLNNSNGLAGPLAPEELAKIYLDTKKNKYVLVF